MSAETLRRAASLMRSRAQAAIQGEWVTVTSAGVGIAPSPVSSMTFATTHGPNVEQSAMDATRIASWHPAVALAVADWLDAEADWAEKDEGSSLALTVAHAYLGEPS